jgi:hypothetical protein
LCKARLRDPGDIGVLGAMNNSFKCSDSSDVAPEFQIRNTSDCS